MENKQISYKSLIGAEISAWIIPLAELRIKVFRDWPYLYSGTIEHEKIYLNRYEKVEKSFVILALDGANVIGASSCIWLPEESDQEIKKTFKERNFNLNDVVYFGESILLSEYRGLGIGSKFMEAREEFAKRVCHAKFAAFCSVIRPEDHPLKPKNYRSLENFWKRRNFIKQENMFCKMTWNDIDQSFDTEKQLQFWIKSL